MKNLLFLALFFSLNSLGQDTLKTFESPVFVSVPNDTVAGIVFKRTATFEALILNHRTRSVSVQWRINYYNEDSVAVDVIPPYYREQNAINSIYILPDGSTAAWSEAELLEKYGVADSDGNYTKTETGKYILTRGDIMDGWSFYSKKATQPIPLTMLIKSAGERAAAEGRLNRK